MILLIKIEIETIVGCWTAQNPSKQFGLRKYITPSTGLRTKGLRLKPNFTIPMGIGKGK